MNSFPRSPREMTQGMMYFPRMLDKIRLHARNELGTDYLSALGQSRRMDGACSHFLRVKYPDLRERVLAGGTNEEILEWCYETGRRLDARDLTIWNAFVSKLGWNDSKTAMLEEEKKKQGITNRKDIKTMVDLIDLEEGRRT